MGLFNAKEKKQKQLEMNREEVLQKIKKGDMSELRQYGHDKEIVLEAIQNSTENITEDIALFLQNSDEDVVCALLERGWGKSWSQYDEKIQNNPYILEIYLTHGGSLKSGEIIEPFFLYYKSLALLSFKIPEMLEDLRVKIVSQFDNDIDVGKEAVCYRGEYIEFLSDEVKNQYVVISNAIKTYPRAIFSVDKMWVSDVRIVETLLKTILSRVQVDTNYPLNEVINILLFIGESAKSPEITKLKNDIIVQVISRDPNSIICFDATVQNNPQILEIFLNYGGDYHKLTHIKIETLNNNINLAIEFVKRGGKDIFEDLNSSLQNNFKVASAAIQKDKSCACLVTDILVLRDLLKLDPSIRQFMDPEVFDKTDALMFEEDKEQFSMKTSENDSIQKSQQEELKYLKNAVENEKLYQERSKKLIEQEETITKQQAEIEFLKQELARLRGESTLGSKPETFGKKENDLEEDLEKGGKKL